jgi:hypothetical protein
VDSTLLTRLKKLWPRLLPVAASLLGLAIISLLLLIYDMPAGVGAGEPPEGVEVVHGAFHVRAQTPSGSDRREEALEAARELGLGFLVLTTQGREPTEEEARADGLVVIPAVELPLEGGTLLLFGEDAQVAPGVPLRDGLGELRARAAGKRLHVGVLARPMSWVDGWDQREYSPALRKHDTVPRAIDDVPRLGVEVLAASVEHENEFSAPYLPAAWYYFVRVFNGPYAAFSLYDRPKDALESWDDLSAGRPWPAPGFCAADAQHQLSDQVTALQTVGTYVHIPKDTPVHERSRAIEKSLRTGWHHCAVDLVGSASAFDFRVVSEKGDRFWAMGDRARFREGLLLRVRAPALGAYPVRVSIFRDGQLAGLRPTRKVDLPLDKPGVYRVEVDVYLDHPIAGANWVPWIYSNPIMVTESAVPDLAPGADPTVPAAPPEGDEG